MFNREGTLLSSNAGRIVEAAVQRQRKESWNAEHEVGAERKAAGRTAWPGSVMMHEPTRARRSAERDGLCTRRHQPPDSSMAGTFSLTPRALLVHRDVHRHCPLPETTNDERDHDRNLAPV
jgi:hypothetical protein